MRLSATAMFGLPEEAPCPWSGHKLSLRYAFPKIRTQKSGRPFGIYWSDELSYGRLWPEPSDDELASFYDSPDYDSYLAGDGLREMVKPGLLGRLVVKLAYLNDRGAGDPIPSIVDLTPPHPTVCDIGCGPGEFLAHMRAAGATVTGVDPSSVSIDALSRLKIDSHRGTAEQLPRSLDGQRFDAVTMFHSLEHCRSPDIAVANALSLLTTGGLLVIEVPNMACIGFKTYAQCWYHTDAGRHLQFFTRSALDHILYKAGARTIKCEFHGLTNQFSPRWISDMAGVWDSLYLNSRAAQQPPRASLARSARYLPFVLMARDELKYEAVRIYARKITTDN